VTGGRPSLEAHHNRVALSNDWTGLAALVSVAERWKNLQRLNSTLFALVVLHAVFYGALSPPASRFTLLLVSTVVAVLAGQAVGISLHRRRRHARAVGPTA
jgi:DMSO/TMAO reductase YedYZ heme-binding membrane subunit